MNSSKASQSSQGVWSMTEWARLEQRTSARVLQCGSEAAAWRALVRQARRVMRAYTTSFFIVSRFLPKAKRVEQNAVKLNLTADEARQQAMGTLRAIYSNMAGAWAAPVRERERAVRFV